MHTLNELELQRLHRHELRQEAETARLARRLRGVKRNSGPSLPGRAWAALRGTEVKITGEENRA